MRFRLIFILCLLLSLAACATVGGEPQDKKNGAQAQPLVAYEGETLVVAGNRYERSTEHYPCRGGMCSPASPLPRYQVGTIMVVVELSEESRIKDLIARYGLSITEQLGSVKVGFFTFVVAVPTFFEEQWTQALSNEPGVKGVGLNRFAYIIRP